MHIDLATLRGLEREQEIPFEELAEIIEQAIHSAYLKHSVERGFPTPAEDVRVELNRKTGDIDIMLTERDEDDAVIGESPAKADDFGRIAASAAKMVINQRLRELADDAVLGEFKGKEGDILRAVIWHSLALALIVGGIVWVYAHLLPGMVVAKG